MRTRLLILLCALVALWGCSTIARLFRPQRQVRPNAVGVVVPLSGRYEEVGKALLEGIRLGVKGSDLRLEVRDSKGEPEEAVRVLEELAAEQQVIAVLGGVVSTEAAELARRADALGVPLLTFSKEEGLTGAGSYVFRNMITVSGQARALARFATCQLGLKSFAVLASDEANARALSSAFAEAVSEAGADVRAPMTFDAGQTTFTSEARLLSGRVDLEKRPEYVAKSKEILEKETDPFRRRKALERLQSSLPPAFDFDALYLPDGWKTVTLIAPALAVQDVVTNACDKQDLEKIRATTGREKLHTAVLLGSSAWHSPETPEGQPELLARGGKFMHCSYYVDGFFEGAARPATKAFVAAFRKQHGGRAPNLLHAFAYDSARMYRQLIESAAPMDSGRFRDLLAALDGFEGATGTTSFDADREAVKPPFFLTLTAGGIREVPVAGRCAGDERAER